MHMCCVEPELGPPDERHCTVPIEFELSEALDSKSSKFSEMPKHQRGSLSRCHLVGVVDVVVCWYVHSFSIWCRVV